MGGRGPEGRLLSYRSHSASSKLGRPVSSNTRRAAVWVRDFVLGVDSFCTGSRPEGESLARGIKFPQSQSDSLL